MADWPEAFWEGPGPLILSAGSSIGAELQIATGSSAPASATWPAANLAIFVPIPVVRRIVITQLGMFNGTAVSGNVDMGIYDSEGNRIVSIGSTAQAGTNAGQAFNITDTTLSPALYYLAAAVDNTTATTVRWSANSLAGRAGGMFQAASAFALPSTVTYAALANSYVPEMFATAGPAI